MITKNINLFIVDKDHQALKSLRRYLVNRFGSRMAISTFFNEASVLQKVDNNTNIVVLKYNVNGGDNDILKLIKKINPATAVIMLSTNEEIGIAIDSFNNATTKNTRGRNSGEIYRIMDFPVRVLVKQFGVSYYVAAFMLSFAAIGICVFIALRIFH